MAQRTHDQNKDHFDLLPFIAILLCLLGALLLVTISIAALSIGPSVGEGWIPVREGSKISKIPILIEWDGAIATVHLEGKKIPIRWLTESTTDYWADKETTLDFKNFLDKLSVIRETHYALFAVRPSGFDNFNILGDQFRDRKIDIGYEPIEQERPVRLYGG